MSVGYETSDVVVVKGLDAVRKRPGMYIGDTDGGSGLHNMLWEVLANSVDEHLAGYCQQIEISLHADGSVTVRDDGRGIPVDADDSGEPYASRCLTQLHTTATRDGHAPHVHVGLSGVGLGAVNALCARFQLDVQIDGGEWMMRCERGEVVVPLRRVADAEVTGTTIHFKPDPEIFAVTEFDFRQIADRCDELAALSSGLRFVLRDERALATIIERPAGLASIVNGEIATRPERGYHAIKCFTLEGEADGLRVAVALLWRLGGETRVSSFVNLQATPGGGSHVEALIQGLAAGWIAAGEPGDIDRARTLLRRGLDAAVHVLPSKHPRFGNPTKDRLDDPEIADLVERAVAPVFTALLRTNPELLEDLRAL